MITKLTKLYTNAVGKILEIQCDKMIINFKE